jgi:hypothetical protein
MNTHSQFKHLLYEFLCHELDDAQMNAVQEHVAKCHACAQELEELKEATGYLAHIATDASAQRPEEFWNEFTTNVERRIKETSTVPSPVLPKIRTSALWEFLEELTSSPKRYGIALGAALAIFLVSVVLWRWYAASREEKIVEQQREANNNLLQARDDSVNAFMRQYVDQSKMLLVGITNAKPVDDGTYDLSVEQEKSRQLIQQARYLEGQPIDPRTARLLNDLQKILIELANMKEQGNAPNVEILRSGVHNENLLFKIRMEEQKYSVSSNHTKTDAF